MEDQSEGVVVLPDGQVTVLIYIYFTHPPVEDQSEGVVVLPDGQVTVLAAVFTTPPVQNQG